MVKKQYFHKSVIPLDGAMQSGFPFIGFHALCFHQLRCHMEMTNEPDDGALFFRRKFLY